MALNDKEEWQCPVCETVNTGDNCTICGTKKNDQNVERTEIPQKTRNEDSDKTQTVNSGDTNLMDSSDELQWERDRWKRVVAIVILSVILISIVIACCTGINDQEQTCQKNAFCASPKEAISVNTENPLGITSVSIQDWNCNIDNCTGVNQNSERVSWVLEIEHTYSLESDIICSWSDLISKEDSHVEYYSLWQTALGGATNYYTTGYDNYENGEYVSTHYETQIYLPDDGSIKGEQYIIINNTKLSFDLIYLGDYSTGRGWDIAKDICITNIKE